MGVTPTEIQVIETVIGCQWEKQWFVPKSMGAPPNGSSSSPSYDLLYTIKIH